MKKYSLDEINSDVQLLEKIKEVDGSGSGLDADLVQGRAGAQLSGKRTITKMCTGHGEMLFLVDGEVWGSNHDGSSYENNLVALSNSADGTPTRGLATSESMIKIRFPASAGAIKDIVIGGHSAYALDDKNRLWTWGSNNLGALGLGHTTDVYLPTLSAIDIKSLPQEVLSDNPLNSSHMIVEKLDGTYVGTGYNAYGQIGDGTTTDSNTWVAVTGLPENSKIVINTYQSMAYKDTLVFAAGRNNIGQLGDGTTDHLSDGFTDVTANWNPNGLTVLDMSHTSIRYDGDDAYNDQNAMVQLGNDTLSEVRVCGDNGYSQLLDETTTNNSLPQLVYSSSEPTTFVKQIKMEGTLGPFAILLESGDLYKWGYNGRGAGGSGSTDTLSSLTLVQQDVEKILTRQRASHQYSWYASAFIKKTDGKTYASGYNSHGQLGIGSATPVTSYTEVLGLPEISDIQYMQSELAGTAQVFLSEDNSHLFTSGYNGKYAITKQTTGNFLSAIELPFTRERG